MSTTRLPTPSGARVTWPDAAPALVLAATAALAMLAWGASPAARYMRHGSTVGHDHAGHGHGDAATGVPLVIAGLAGAWLLMTVATMLPTAVPLLAAVRGLGTGQGAVGAAIAGFLTVWAAVGLAVAVVDLQLQRWVEPEAAPLLLAGTLATAGGYQVSGRAARCLRQCRHPFGFVARHWTGRPDVTRQGFTIGTAYGFSCLGCCAALMVVMFALGLGNPAWMLLFATVGAVQKAAPWGEALTLPLGLALLVTAAVLATTQVVS